MVFTQKKYCQLFLSFMILRASHSTARTIVIAADTWCPYNCEATSIDRGFMVDILAEVLAPHGYTIQYRNKAWTQAMEDVVSGRIDAIVGAGATEAKDLIVPTEPLGINKTCVFGGYGTKLRYTGIKSLESMKLGVIAGYLYGKNIDDYIESNRIRFDKVQLVTGDKPLLQNIKKLQAGRIDALVENEMVMDFSFRKFNVAGMQNIGCEVETPVFVAFSPKITDAQKMARLVNEGMPKLRKSGKLAKILERYGVKDWNR